MSNPFSDNLIMFDKLRPTEILRCRSSEYILTGKFIGQRRERRALPDDKIFTRVLRRRSFRGMYPMGAVFHESSGDYITDLNSVPGLFDGMLMESSSRKIATVGCQMQLAFISRLPGGIKSHLRENARGVLSSKNFD